MPKVEVSGIWLRRLFGRAELLVEIDGKWKLVHIYSGKLAGALEDFPCSEIIEMRPGCWEDDPNE